MATTNETTNETTNLWTWVCYKYDQQYTDPMISTMISSRSDSHAPTQEWLQAGTSTGDGLSKESVFREASRFNISWRNAGVQPSVSMIADVLFQNFAFKIHLPTPWHCLEVLESERFCWRIGSIPKPGSLVELNQNACFAAFFINPSKCRTIQTKGIFQHLEIFCKSIINLLNLLRLSIFYIFPKFRNISSNKKFNETAFVESLETIRWLGMTDLNGDGILLSPLTWKRLADETLNEVTAVPNRTWTPWGTEGQVLLGLWTWWWRDEEMRSKKKVGKLQLVNCNTCFGLWVASFQQIWDVLDLHISSVT